MFLVLMNSYILTMHEKNEATNQSQYCNKATSIFFHHSLYFLTHSKTQVVYLGNWSIEMQSRFSLWTRKVYLRIELLRSSSHFQIQTVPIVFLHVILLQVIIIVVSLNVVNYRVRYTILCKYYTLQWISLKVSESSVNVRKSRKRIS